MDVLTTAGLLRVPVLIEYDELKKIQLNAVTDPLTGLYNRRIFGESFERELNRAKRYSLPFGLVMMDMHRFKEVNDKHGHPRGDEVLRVAAATLKKALRTSDLAFRIGGDEFALILPQTDAAQALALSRRVETVFEESLKPLQLSVTVGMDHGVANYPQDADNSEDLIRIADDRLYQRKPCQCRREHDRYPSSRQQPEPATLTANFAPAPERLPRRRPDSIEIEARCREKEEVKEARRPRQNLRRLLFAPASTSSAPSQPANQSPSQQAAPSAPSVAPSLQIRDRAHLHCAAQSRTRLDDRHQRLRRTRRQGLRRARVLDLGFRRRRARTRIPEALTEVVLAVLHVPILPPVRVNLKPVWSHRTDMGVYRVGLHFRLLTALSRPVQPAAHVP